MQSQGVAVVEVEYLRVVKVELRILCIGYVEQCPLALTVLLELEHTAQSVQDIPGQFSPCPEGMA